MDNRNDTAPIPQYSLGKTLLVWLVPIIFLIAAYQMLVSGVVQRAWLSIFPFMAEAPGYSVGAWFGIIAHSGQSVHFAFLLLGLVLGWANNRGQ